MEENDLSLAADPQGLMLEDRGITDFLEHLTVLGEKLFTAAKAVGAIDESVPCALMSQRGNNKTIVTSSSPAAVRLNEAQYTVGQGPSLHAMITSGLVVIDDARDDTRWADYFRIAVSMDFLSMLSVPLQVGSEGFAALNFYSQSPGFFTSERQHIGAVFAEQASSALEMAMRVARHQDISDDMRSAMETRTSIDIAVGIIIAQNKCTQDEAFAILRSASNSRNTKLNKVAGDLILRASGTTTTTHFIN